MCGIIAHVGTDDAVEPLLSGLRNLEYRGYDSAGVALQNGSGIVVSKRSGKVDELVERVRPDPPSGNVGIGHTRWSTHGPPADRNAHPHTDTVGDVAVVHNGVVENHEALRERLSRAGHTFESDTDTEVIPHLFEEYRGRCERTEEAFRRAIRDIEGSYAIAALVDGEDAVYAAREGSPLVLGIGDGEYFVASDVPAFLEHTHRVVYLEDEDVAVVRPDGYTLTDVDGTPVSRPVDDVDWNPEEIEKGAYDHYMVKEIHAQPAALTDAIQGRIDRESGAVRLDDVGARTVADVEAVQLVGCGTSYHAAVYGERLLTSRGVRARAILASEYEDAREPTDEGTLQIAVTQSGETADTLNAVRRARESGARTLAVTNVRGSSVTRETDDAMFIRAGPEIGVAATKTFSSQAVTLSLLARRIAGDRPERDEGDGGADFGEAIHDLPERIERVLEQTAAERVAERHAGSEAFFFIGRGLGYPVAMEGALKFKEITYEHAEGFAAGELKHGPLALVTPRTPVVAVFTGHNDEKTLTNAKEVQTRGARIVAVAPDGHPATRIADDHLWIPDTAPELAGVLANVQLQLLAYHSADLLGREIDKPRNLAKSVTVD